MATVTLTPNCQLFLRGFDLLPRGTAATSTTIGDVVELDPRDTACALGRLLELELVTSEDQPLDPITRQPTTDPFAIDPYTSDPLALTTLGRQVLDQMP